MSSAPNPYAPPQAEVEAAPAETAGLAREGRLVRMALGGRFPDRCIRCDAPAEGYRIERALYWRPRWWRAAMWITLPLLFVLAGIDPLVLAAFWLAVLGFGIADFFVRRKITVELGLCGRHRRWRAGVTAGFAASWVLLIALVLSTASGFRPVEEWWFWLIVLAMFALAIASGFLYRVGIARLTAAHVWLRGTGRPFLDALPLASE